MIIKGHNFIITQHEIDSNIILCPYCQEILGYNICNVCNNKIDYSKIKYIYRYLINSQLEPLKKLVLILKSKNYLNHAEILSLLITMYQKKDDINYDYLYAYTLLENIIINTKRSKDTKIKNIGIKASTIKYLLGQKINTYILNRSFQNIV